jgi:hypothetical protein
MKMDDQVAFLFHLSQTGDIRNNSHELPTVAGHHDDLSFWTQIGLKHYGHYLAPPPLDGSGEETSHQVHQKYARSPPSVSGGLQIPDSLHLVNILRLTVDCPFQDIQQEAKIVLEQLSVSYTQIFL